MENKTYMPLNQSIIIHDLTCNLCLILWKRFKCEIELYMVRIVKIICLLTQSSPTLYRQCVDLYGLPWRWSCESYVWWRRWWRWWSWGWSWSHCHVGYGGNSSNNNNKCIVYVVEEIALCQCDPNSDWLCIREYCTSRNFHCYFI